MFALANCFLINFSKILDNMVVSCCAVDCSNRFKLKEEGELDFFVFLMEKKGSEETITVDRSNEKSLVNLPPYGRVC